MKTRARVMLTNLGPNGRELWPSAAQRACWRLRHATDTSRRVVPACGDQVTVKLYTGTSGRLCAARKVMNYLGVIDGVAPVVLVEAMADVLGLKKGQASEEAAARILAARTRAIVASE